MSKKTKKLLIIDSNSSNSDPIMNKGLIIKNTSSSSKKIPLSQIEKPILSENENPCNKENELREKRKQLNTHLKILHTECEKTKYETIYKYFNLERNNTYKDLLNALMHYYKDQKSNESNFILPFEGFLDMFERDTMKYKNFKKQHVFEALCKILLMYDYDDGELGRDKQFYNSLENFIKNPESSSNIKTREQIINGNINVSSEGGVVDIFFKTKQQNYKKSECKWVCDCVNDKSNETIVDGQEYILIQNKYYSKEKSDIKNYDYLEIFVKAQPLYKSHIIPKIILMVNNKQALNDKLLRSRNSNKEKIDSIYGVYEIDKWFNLLLYDLLNSDNIDDFLIKKGTKDKVKPELTPRFHQMYFTMSTIEYNKEGYKKFIWGAVPRSGKSYMIGDLISHRKHSFYNDVIVILGAKTETESQFIEMFSEFSNFNDYGIIKISTGKTRVLKDKNIYIFSQEWFKDKLIGDEFKPKVKEDYVDLFRSGNTVDIYFDEVHKGGTTDKSENILNAINNVGVKIDIFVMVTATFAKPNIKYRTNFIDTKEPKILEWSYEDQQIMKTIKNETKMDMMINSREGIERKIIADIFQYYRELYHNEFLDIISKQYARHPELVLVQPFEQIGNIEKNYTDFKMNQIFIRNLKCDACFPVQTLEELRNPNRIFFDYGRVKILLELISGNLNPKNSVYGYLNDIGAPSYSQKHSELWFLPDDDLYVSPDECRQDNRCGLIKTEKKYDENFKDKQKSLPNIEALTRGLSFALMENRFFRENYNILIVHNTPVDFTNSINNTKIPYEKIFEGTGIETTYKSKNLSETIRDYEFKTYSEGKNLIILTGSKLRLGISLPCVDIGFNFDNIQSVDMNYQTMFRVLTERYNKPKKCGYYIDFNKERFITFLYQYGNTYSSAKNISDIKENITYLKGLLLLFNVNGIGLDKLDEKSELKLYNSLINELKIDENGYKEYYSDFDNITNLFKKSLISVNYTDLQKFSKLIQIVKNTKNGKQKKLKKILTEGERVGPAIMDTSSDNEEEKSQIENEDEETDSLDLVIKNISEMLPRIVALLAIFSDKNNYNCDKLNQCLEIAISNITDFGNLCNCDIVRNSNILSCYFNSSFYNEKLFVLLTMIRELLNNPENRQLNDSTNFIYNNIIGMTKRDKPLIITMSPEEIQKTIEKYLPVREEKKNKNGEVFTPIKLIEEMLSKLPPSVWTNPELKWLDPANGIGNFPMVVYSKLLKELPENYDGENGSYSTLDGKKKHIIEKMLYMNELDPANVKISRRIFGKKANICCSDFIKGFDNCVKHFGISKFDIIMGNPPYNATSTGRSGEKHLDDAFINESLLNYLNNNGYLLFVTKTNWRSINSSVYENVIDKQIVYIKTYDFKNKPFSENLIPCYYLIKNSPKTKETIFEYLDETEKNNIIKGMNIYFLYRPYINYLDKLKKQYGNLSSITRKKKESGSEYLLISFSTPEVLIERTVPKGDRYYVITNPNKLMKFFFQSNIYKELRELGRFSGFSTPKDLFYDIPDFNNITKSDEQNEVLQMLGKYNNPKLTGIKIKNFITKKHREKKQKTQKNSKGGKIGTRKQSHLKKTRKAYFSIF